MDSNPYVNNAVYREKTPEEVEQENQKRSGIFSRLLLPCILLAVLGTVFLYDADGGIFPVFFPIVFYLWLVKVTDRIDRQDLFFFVIMELIAISSFLTGNYFVINMNCFFMFAVGALWAVSRYRNISGYDLGKGILVWCESVLGCLPGLSDFFEDTSEYAKTHNRAKRGKSTTVIVGVLIAVPLTALVLYLLAEADAVFMSGLASIIPKLDITNIVEIIIYALAIFFFSYCAVRYQMHDRVEKQGRNPGFSRVTAVIIMMPLAIIYAVFGIVQIIYLFAGAGSLPEGYTYSSYAREGFFQLLFLCILNLILVRIVEKCFEKSGLTDILSLVICACTILIDVSSVFRMIMYIQSYRLTQQRILTLFVDAGVLLLVAGVIIMQLKPDFRLGRYSFTCLMVVWLAFAFAKPDFIIASYNLSNQAISVGQRDDDYVASLSSDAYAVVRNHKHQISTDDMKAYQESLSNERKMRAKDFRCFNLSVYMAR